MQKKVEGKEITMAEAPQEGAQVIDLMEALRASLEKKPAKKAQTTKWLPEKPRRSSVQRFGVREVEKLLRLPRRTIHGLVKAGFVSPARGPRQAYLFSFQDLIVLRTAQALATAKVPARRIAASCASCAAICPTRCRSRGSASARSATASW